MMLSFSKIQPYLTASGFPVCGACRFDELAGRLLDCRASARLPKEAKTVLMLLLPYLVSKEPSNLSRYARVPDYHEVAAGMLGDAAARLQAAFPAACFAFFVDNSPIPEVYAAAKAGLGVIGENGLLISEAYGSWCFLCEIVTNLEVEPTGGQVRRCAGCMACRAACPGKALSEGGVQKERCLSAVTQKKGDLTGREERLLAESGVCWGCDVCQEVCPYNEKARKTHVPAFLSGYQAEYTGEAEEHALRRAWEWRPKRVIERNYGITGRKDGNTSPIEEPDS